MASFHYEQGDFRGYQTSMSSPSLPGTRGRPYGQQQHHQHAADGAPVFTAEMRDRQARGKDPYHESEDSEDANYWGGGRHRRDEPFAVVDQRRKAVQVLDTPELLMTYAQRDNESVPATRLRYTRMLCGVAADGSAQGASSSKKTSKKSSSSHHRSGGSSSSRSTPTKRTGGSDHRSSR
ncbi:hypothetical protein JX265_004964 [Neoarthrinium moseri]|uniref:Uncharacterized protein n=1 Tax=Neoarthrinium moseri TaxID=1658444 RepID=A0A9Q0AQA7_9PEZI|nr:hypothetical protein JX266_007410 [Neoarthrinium moseri]KAI1873342.1 hypothetical protein JX265_004964 [Neoarthrinium moseri]